MSKILPLIVFSLLLSGDLVAEPGRRAISSLESSAQSDDESKYSANKARLKSSEVEGGSDQKPSMRGGASDRSTWAGERARYNDNEFSGGEILIKDVTKTGFSFELNVFNGAHMGEISGVARFKGGDAVFREPQRDGGCEVLFSMKGENIEIGTTEDCGRYGGMGVTFDGVYRKGGVQKKNSSLLDIGVLNDKAEDDAFREVVKKDYQAFLSNSQLIMEGTDEDGFGARVVTTAVRGMFSIYESIIMITTEGKIWAATTVVPQEDRPTVIKYFTNDPGYTDKLPKTIELWREGMEDYQVIFANGQPPGTKVDTPASP